MVYKTKCCPHCGKPYSIMQPAKSGFYGSPFRRCQFCFQQFIDKDYREIAVSGIRKVDTMKVSVGTALLGVFPAMFFAVGIWLLFVLPGNTTALVLTFGGAVAVAIAVWLCWSEAKGYAERQNFLRGETIHSEARLANPRYALALKQLGYRVPQKYLPKEGDNSHVG